MLWQRKKAKPGDDAGGVVDAGGTPAPSDDGSLWTWLSGLFHADGGHSHHGAADGAAADPGTPVDGGGNSQHSCSSGHACSSGHSCGSHGCGSGH